MSTVHRTSSKITNAYFIFGVESNIYSEFHLKYQHNSTGRILCAIDNNKVPQGKTVFKSY